MECHARAECEAGTHTRRIGRYRFVEILPELSKPLHVFDLFAHQRPAHTMDAADKFHVVPPGQRRLHPARQTDRPGQTGGRDDVTRIRQVHLAQQTHQRGLARTVAPDQADVRASRYLERQITEHVLSAAQCEVRLCEVFQPDHIVTLDRKRSRYNARPPNSETSARDSGYITLSWRIGS